jgi:hypothetical protein
METRTHVGNENAFGIILRTKLMKDLPTWLQSRREPDKPNLGGSPEIPQCLPQSSAELPPAYPSTRGDVVTRSAQWMHTQEAMWREKYFEASRGETRSQGGLLL